MNDDLISYYRDRAKEYERIYSKPERQTDIQKAANLLQEIFKNKDILEIACGTGFWTEYIAQTASSVLATDINLAVIAIAREKKIRNSKLIFEVADIYTFQKEKHYESLFAGFIWSHIPKQQLAHFFETINGFVKEKGSVVLMDNLYVEGSNHPITHTDEYGNTFQTRKLDDGSIHKVLKNFASEDLLREQVKDFAGEIQWIQLEFFWILIYKRK